MAHRWGQNVWDFGLGYVGATICSRFLAAPQLVLTNARVPDAPHLALAITLPNLADDPYLFGAIDTTGRGNFPYGYDVQPDQPL